MPDRDIHSSAPRSLAKLMSLEAAADWQPDELGAIFRHQLQSRIEGASKTFGEVLRDPQIEDLKLVKEFGKLHRNDPASPLPRDIATVLYFAAIVAARKHCRQTITNLDEDSIRRGVEWAVAQPWLYETTRSLFHNE
jgi:hypothetical protein